MAFYTSHEEDSMTVIIGIDPHKATHMAVAIDGDEQPIGRLEVLADRCQTQRLLRGPYRWVRNARGRSSRRRDRQVVVPAAPRRR